MRAYAKQQGINLKIDYVNQALEEFMENMSEYSSKYPDKITVSIIERVSYLSEISPLLATVWHWTTDRFR